jgi:hypothetical protein
VQNGFCIGESHHVEPSLNSVTGPAGINRLEPNYGVLSDADDQLPLRVTRTSDACLVPLVSS